jgi:isopentenyl-diphosphate delta-isomerase
MSTSEIQNRKQAHIDICRKPKSQGEGNLFSGYRLPYTALPELDLADISTGVTLLGKKLSQPLIIGSMTGGVAHAKTINTHLALAAEELQVALGVGSQRIALEREEAQETFKLVRQFAPTTVLFANMGAVQLNYGREVGDYRRIVDMVKADGLYLHINPLQEALQPGGDTNFRGLLDKVAQVVKHVGVPVFVKEVGHGLDVRTAQALIDRGVVGIDAAGVGGTSWAWVEANRALNNLYESWFKSHGHRTDELIVDYQQLVGDPIKVVSGGD